MVDRMLGLAVKDLGGRLQALTPYAGRVLAAAGPGTGALGAASPYPGGLGATQPYSAGLAATQPYTPGLGAAQPYGPGLGAAQPYHGGLAAASANPYGHPLPAASPYGAGLAATPLGGGFLQGNTAWLGLPTTKQTSPNGGLLPATPTGALGTSAGLGGWNPAVAQWDAPARAAVAGTDIDPDIFLALITNESQGIQEAHNAGGASGLLQLMPGVWNANENPFNGQDNLAAGTRLMLEKERAVRATYAKLGINRTGREFALDLAKAWLGGFDYDTGLSNGLADSNGTTGDSYALKFGQEYDAIKQARLAQAQQAQASTVSPGGTYAGGGLPQITGGLGQVSQEFGDTDYSATSGTLYDYGSSYGVHGHTGIDWGVPAGTQVFSPVGGKVITAGGTAFFRDEDENSAGISPAGQGELRIQLDNGDQLILGHTRSINVRPGDRVNPGQLVAISGSANGPHVHVEYRKVDPSMPSGYRIIDPRGPLGGSK